MIPSKSAPSKPPGRFYDLCRWVWVGVFGCTMRVFATGLQAAEGDGGMIIAVSHVSHLDPVVVSALVGRRISWVSRIEFYQQWFMRTVLHHGGAFRVDRQGSALPTIREGLRRLERGETVGIFPEGELMSGENSVLRGAEIKKGVCLLAARSQRPVVPVVVVGTDRLNRVGPWMPAKRGRLWIHAGKPIHAKEGSTDRRGRDEFAALLMAEYVRLYTELREKFDLPDSIVP